MPARVSSRPVVAVMSAMLFAGACGSAPLPSTATPVSPVPRASLEGPGPSIDSTTFTGTIVYSAEIGGNEDVFLLRLDGSGPVRLTDDSAQEFDPDLSPDGTRIAYRRNPSSSSDHADIWIMDVDGSDKRNLTDSPQFSNWAPSWTPDGRIAFSSSRGSPGALETWTMTADGSDKKRVAEGWCEYPAPDPTGARFVCASPTGGRYDIHVLVDGEHHPLTTTPETEFGASWSPDGQWIAYSRDTGEHWELWVIRPDGTSERQVAPEGVFSTWSPAGTARVVGSGRHQRRKSGRLGSHRPRLPGRLPVVGTLNGWRSSHRAVDWDRTGRRMTLARHGGGAWTPSS